MKWLEVINRLISSAWKNNRKGNTLRKESEYIDAMGQRIKRRRKQLGLTAKVVALTAKIDEKTLYSIEEGRVKNPGIMTLARIADALLVYPGWLVYGEDSLYIA